MNNGQDISLNKKISYEAYEYHLLKQVSSNNPTIVYIMTKIRNRVILLIIFMFTNIYNIHELVGCAKI